MSNVIWKPQPKQVIFMARPEYEVLYGGAAGGGKSDAIIAEALRQVDIPHYKGLILRKTYPQLSELIDKSFNIYPKAYPKAKYNDTKHTWYFPSGAKIIFGAMQYTKDKHKYQGKAYDFIAFDELTHFTYEEYNYLFSRNRPNGPGTRCYIRATANPGGVGHGWVKERFINAAPPMTPILTETEVNGRKYSFKRLFVPASVFDNNKLLDNDPMYVGRLNMLPTAERNALLYGDWDSFSGQVFCEWRNDPEHYADRRYTHVIDPFPLPRHWRRYRSFDFGYAKPFAVQWWAVDMDGRAYLYRQLYGCTDTPNTGVKWEPHEIARKIREIEDSEMAGLKIYGVADPSIWDESRGSNGTVINMFEREGIYFEPGDNKRIPGKMQLHYRLAFDNEGLPMMYVFNTCKEFIRTMPALVYDETDVEDIDTKQEDHDYDACRYFCMENPLAERRNIPPRKTEYNPLDTTVEISGEFTNAFVRDTVVY